MKGMKKNSEGAIGSINPPSSTIVAAKGFDTDNSKPRYPQEERAKPAAQISDRPPAQSRPDDASKKAKKKAGDEKWPFASITPQDLENEIRERAFYIYLQRGSEGDSHADWLQAEAEIKRKYGINT